MHTRLEFNLAQDTESCQASVRTRINGSSAFASGPFRRIRKPNSDGFFAARQKKSRDVADIHRQVGEIVKKVAQLIRTPFSIRRG